MKRFVITVEDDYPYEKLQKEYIDVVPYEPNSLLLADEDANIDNLLSLIHEIRNDEDSVINKIQDPVAWQREIREDRELPFRKD